MLVTLRRGYAQLITSAAPLTLFGVAVGLATPQALIACCTLAAGISVLAWTSVMRRARAIADTPTSRIAAAAQGYVELRGRGKPLAGVPLISPLSGLPCLWYRYRIERRDGNNRWVYEDGGESEDSFILDDGSAECLVDPEGAEMLVTRKDRWINNGRRYTQWALISSDPIYALGQFATLGTVEIDAGVSERVKDLLADWKRDQPRLIERFDSNGDGQIDVAEWAAARAAAKGEVVRDQREALAHAQVNLLRRPDSGTLYLVSNIDPALLARRYRLWSVFHLALFFVALAAIAFAAHTLGPAGVT